MHTSPRDRHRRYGATLAATTLLAAGMIVGVLAFAPAPPLRPYELRAELAPASAAREPLQLLTVQPVPDAVAAPAQPLGPADDVEPETWFALAPVAAPPATPSRPAVASPRVDFQPITHEMLATQALFRMRPVFDALPRDLALDRVVVVKVRVTKKGEVVEARVTKGIDDVLDRQALQAAWQYRVAFNDEGERPGWVTLPYEFLDLP